VGKRRCLLIRSALAGVLALVITALGLGLVGWD